MRSNLALDTDHAFASRAQPRGSCSSHRVRACGGGTFSRTGSGSRQRAGTVMVAEARPTVPRSWRARHLGAEWPTPTGLLRRSGAGQAILAGQGPLR